MPVLREQRGNREKQNKKGARSEGTSGEKAEKDRKNPWEKVQAKKEKGGGKGLTGPVQQKTISKVTREKGRFQTTKLPPPQSKRKGKIPNSQ